MSLADAAPISEAFRELQKANAQVELFLSSLGAGSTPREIVRKSLGIRNWESGQKIVRDWESRVGGSLISAKDAFERYIADCEARHLRSESLRKYRLMQREILGEFGGRPLDAVGIEELSRYREKWTLAPGTARTKIGLLRAFFRFCVNRGWLEKNPALLLKHPRAVHKPTLPLSDDDFEKLLKATERFPVGGVYKERTGQRLKAFDSCAPVFGPEDSGLRAFEAREAARRPYFPLFAKDGSSGMGADSRLCRERT